MKPIIANEIDMNKCCFVDNTIYRTMPESPHVEGERKVERRAEWSEYSIENDLPDLCMNKYEYTNTHTLTNNPPAK